MYAFLTGKDHPQAGEGGAINGKEGFDQAGHEQFATFISTAAKGERGKLD
jgi:hypothetical protein